jgi:methionyl-tRNA formyltransferase
MRILFLGSGEFGCASLRNLRDHGHDISLVITQPARPGGRGRKPLETPISQLCQELKLPCLECKNVNEAEVVNQITKLQPEVILVIAFGQKIGAEILKIPNCHVCNLHASLLPKYRGAAPINWAILKGETHTGLTVFELDENWDSGAIWGQIKTEIASGETASELHDRLASLAPPLLDEVLIAIDADASRPEIQQHEQATRAPKLKKVDGAIDWSKSAQEISRHVAGLWSWPGAYCYLQKSGGKKPQRLTLARALPGEANAGDKPGAFLKDMTVVCGQGSLRILEVKPDGSRLMSFTDLINGQHLTHQDCLKNG